MAQLVSIQQAAANALALWLKTSFNDSTITVEPRWPDPNNTLSNRTVTITLAGPRQITMHTVPGEGGGIVVGANLTTFNWIVGNIDQPLQLDVWATNEYALDDLIARLDTALHSGTVFTLPSIANGNGDPIANGVLLPLSDGWGGYVDCFFDDDGPQLLDNSDRVDRDEFRATWRGHAYCVLTQAATTGRMANIKFRERVNETMPTTGNYDLVITDAEGVITRAKNTT